MLAITGGKGGAGKTTTTLALARALARRGQTVRAVDADRDMPNLHELAGVPAAPTIGALSTGQPASDVCHAVPDAPGVDVVPAASHADEVDLPAALSLLAEGTDHVLVDCPAGASVDAVAPVRAADAALVVTSPTPQSLTDAAKTVAFSRAVGTPVVGCVLTASDEVPARLPSFVGTERCLAIPRSDDPLSDPRVEAAYDSCVRVLSPSFHEAKGYLDPRRIG